MTNNDWTAFRKANKGLGKTPKQLSEEYKKMKEAAATVNPEPEKTEPETASSSTSEQKPASPSRTQSSNGCKGACSTCCSKVKPKRALSAYNKFCQEHSKDPEIKEIKDSKERMRALAALWRKEKELKASSSKSEDTAESKTE